MSLSKNHGRHYKKCGVQILRNSLIKALLSHADDPKFCVISGDLGWGVFEPLQKALVDRFINAGIAEQNMMSLAAGLAACGMRPFVYSISPFVYARPFEQIRNDICLQDLPVCLIASGAGYGYGNNGPSHHALEDYGTMSALQNIKIFVPSFVSDMQAIADEAMKTSHPVYIRLGRDEREKIFPVPKFAPYRKIKDGSAGVVLVIGNMAGSVIEICDENFSLWACGVLPVVQENIPSELFESIKKSGTLIIVEDHVAAGGLAGQFSACMLEAGILPKNFARFYAHGYSDELYGSQNFYRENNGLSFEAIKNKMREFSR